MHFSHTFFPSTPFFSSRHFSFHQLLPPRANFPSLLHGVPPLPLPFAWYLSRRWNIWACGNVTQRWLLPRGEGKGQGGLVACRLTPAWPSKLIPLLTRLSLEVDGVVSASSLTRMNPFCWRQYFTCSLTVPSSLLRLIEQFNAGLLITITLTLVFTSNVLGNKFQV